MVVLRHKMYPIHIVYRDPKESWDGIVKERILEELCERGFDRFVLEEEKNIEKKSVDP